MKRENLLTKLLLSLVFLLFFCFSSKTGAFAQIANNVNTVENQKRVNEMGKPISTKFPEVYIDSSVKGLTLNPSEKKNHVFQLFSHGKPGELLINGKWLDAPEIAKFLKTTISHQPSTTKHINIYGCEFAKGIKGLQAVALLERELGVSVSASTNITGIDGDWNLEVGNNKDVLALNEYKGNLQTCTSYPWKTFEDKIAITPSTTATVGGGTVSKLVDGSNTNSFYYSAATGLTDKDILSLNLAYPAVFDSFEFVLDRTTSCFTSGTQYKVQGLSGGVWSDISSYTAAPATGVGSITTDPNVIKLPFTNTTEYDGYRILINGGLSAAPYIKEVNINQKVCTEAEVCTGGTVGSAAPNGDYDGDGVINSCDLDDDNDGILDNDEKTCTPIVNTPNSAASGVNPVFKYFHHFKNGVAVELNSNGYLDGDITSNVSTGPSNVPVMDSTVFYFKGAYTNQNTIMTLFNDAGVLGNAEGWRKYSSVVIRDVNNAIIYTGPARDFGATGNATETEFWNFGSLKDASTITFYDVEDRTGYRGYGGREVKINAGGTFAASCVPKDTDGDSIPDYLDLDSDNDGCADALEGGANLAASTVTESITIPGGNTNDGNPNNGIYNFEVKKFLGLTVNANGIPTTTGIHQSLGQGIGSSQMPGTQSAVCNCLGGTVGSTAATGDYDGDGVKNSCDLDDDNDGILDTVECDNLQRNVVKNGEFSNGLTNWTSTGNWNVVTVGSNSFASNEIYSLTPKTLTQTISNLVDDPIVLQFKVSVNNLNGVISGPQFGILDVLLNNTKYASVDNPAFEPLYATVNAFNGASVSISKVTVSTSALDIPTELVTVTIPKGSIPSTADLTFSFTNSGDDVRVDAVYVASLSNCDYDGDGIPNVFDLDSDNDGCPDALEGDANLAASTVSDSNMSGGNTNATSGTYNQPVKKNLGNTVGSATDTMGVPTVAGTGQGIGSSQMPGTQAATCACIGGTVGSAAPNGDYDGDGVKNSCDLDDDNDGILDTVECPSPSATLASSYLQTFPATVNGVTVSVSYTNGTVPAGYVAASTYNTSSFGSGGPCGFTYPPVVAFSGNYAAATSITFNFSSPVNHIQMVVAASGVKTSSTVRDNLVITTSGGNPILTAMPNFCTGGTIIGNTFSATTTNADQLLEITAPSAFTTLTITQAESKVGNGGVGINLILSCDTDVDGIINQFDLDSDNDGCPDALEGGANFASSTLSDSTTIPGGNTDDGLNTNGTYNQPVIKNLGNAVGSGTDTMGVPTVAGTGQGVGSSQLPGTQAATCSTFCYKPAATSGTALDTKHGITALGRAGSEKDNWPMVRKGAWTVLEAKTKGFVVNRLTDAQITLIPAANLREGMMVYNISQDCLQINVDGTAAGWKCFTTQTCPD